MRLAVLLAQTLATLCACAGMAAAQSYPTQAVRVFVPALAGSHADVVIRPIARKLSESFRQSVTVDNRPGAAGTIGVELAARGAPDGHTLLVAAIDHVAAPPALYAKLAYDVQRDLAPVLVLAHAPYALFAHPSLPVRSVRDLVALARARPGQITYASAGAGSVTHFFTESLNSTLGVKLIHVPYQGSALSAAALLGGDVMTSFDVLQAALAHVRGQRLRALAIGAPRRAQAAPEIQTFAEAGYPDFDASAWFGLFVPVNTPQDVIDKLHAEAVKVLGMREIRDQLEHAGIEPGGGTPEQFARQVRDDIARFGRIAREAGIRAR